MNPCPRIVKMGRPLLDYAVDPVAAPEVTALPFTRRSDPSRWKSLIWEPEVVKHDGLVRTAQLTKGNRALSSIRQEKVGSKMS